MLNLVNMQHNTLFQYVFSAALYQNIFIIMKY